MKKFVSPFVFVLFTVLQVRAQNNLAMLYSSTGMEYGKASAVDADTNYINGSLFQNSIDVDPNGTFMLTAPGATTQIALTKYNRHGQLVWAKMIGGTTTSEAPHGIDCDAAKNIYVTGYFGSTSLTGPQNANFNPLGGGTVATQGNEDCFVAKYNENGNYQWAFGLGNTGANTQERSWDISTDANGNSYVVGGFHGTMNFNPLGTAMNYSLPDTLTGLFIAKYNTNGICQWVITIDAQCTSVFTEGYATCDLDGNGSLYVAGNFRGSGINFNPLGTSVTLSSSGLTDIFLAKYNTSNGTLNWVKKIGGAAPDLVSPGALRCDNNGNPYFTGRLSGTASVDFDPGTGTTNISNSALYLATFDPDGNLRYAIGMNSGTGDGGHRVSFDNANNVYLAGWMNGNATFGNISRTANSTTADVFIAKYNNNLSTCYWAFNFGGTGSSANSICAGLSVDQENNAIITGQLYGMNADIDPSPDIFNLSSLGNNDCFVIKYNSNGSLWVNATGATIYGSITYDNSNSTPLSNIKVLLRSGNVAVDSAITDTTGNFSFFNIPVGTYSVICSTTKTWGGVNAADALIALKHFVGMGALTGIRFTAADVSMNNYINSQDALFISKRFTGLVSSFTQGDWIFNPAPVIINGTSNVNVTIKGICAGDVNGSYIPPN